MAQKINITQYQNEGPTAFTPSFTGFSGSPTRRCYYSRVGNMVWVKIYIDGTSNSTALTVSLPFAIDSNSNFDFIPCHSRNNAVNNTGICNISGSTLTAFVNPAGDLWTASGSKRLSVQFFYPIAV